MGRISHKNILLYGHVFYDHSSKRDHISFKDIFGEISRLRNEFTSAQNTIDNYVNLILYGANSGWRGAARSSGKTYCNKYLEHNKSIMIVPDPDDGETKGKGQDDILSDLLILSAADHYFKKAWDSYRITLDEKLPEYFDLPAADKYRRELIGMIGEKAANNLLVQMWHGFYGQSFLEVFHEGFTSVVLDIALDIDYEADKIVWQILLENFNQQ